MRKVIVILSPNLTVTKNNFDIIIQAANKKGLQVLECHTVQEAEKVGGKNDIYVLSGSGDVLNLYYSGRKNIFHWVQGIIPEESFMRHNSWWRFKILSWKEMLSLKHSKVCAFVGEPMREHYEKKYHLSFPNYYIFPCFNTTLAPEAFNVKDKYENNYFVYAGGLAVWQCFAETLDIYKKIEDWNIPNTKLIVLTKDQDLAKQMIETKGIRYYTTGFTTPEELPKVLKDAKFGFVIRKESPVNRVATPTKISTYLSCGLIPIFGEAVETFKQLSEKMRFKVAWSGSDVDYSIVRDLMTSNIDYNDVLKEYNQFFEDNYSRDKHIEKIGELLEKI